MNGQKELKIITKQSMHSVEATQFNGYDIAYYLQKDPKKEICEDALLVRTEGHTIMLAVCDGVGSSDRSYRAAKNTLTWLSELPISIDTDDLYHEIMNINQKLIKLDGSPESTLTMSIINTKDHNYTCWQAGDSGLIHCSNRGNMKYRSSVHSPVGQEFENGLITEKQALEHPDLFIVSNVLGTEEFYVDCSAVTELSLHDSLLLTSDGLLDNFLISEFTDLIAKGDAVHASNNLYQSACSFKNIQSDKKFKKVDDICFILLKSSSTAQKATTEK